MASYRKWFDGPLMRKPGLGTELVWRIEEVRQKRSWKVATTGLVIFTLGQIWQTSDGASLILGTIPGSVLLLIGGLGFLIRQTLRIDPVNRTFKWRQSTGLFTRQCEGSLDNGCRLVIWEHAEATSDGQMGKAAEFQFINFESAAPDVRVTIYRTEGRLIQGAVNELQKELGIPITVGSRSLMLDGVSASYLPLSDHGTRSILERSDTRLRVAPAPMQALSVSLPLLAVGGLFLLAWLNQLPLSLLSVLGALHGIWLVLAVLCLAGSLLPALRELVHGPEETAFEFLGRDLRVVAETPSGLRRTVGTCDLSTVRTFLYRHSKFASVRSLLLIPRANTITPRILAGHDEATIRAATDWLAEKLGESRSLPQSFDLPPPSTFKIPFLQSKKYAVALVSFGVFLAYLYLNGQT